MDNQAEDSRRRYRHIPHSTHLARQGSWEATLQRLAEEDVALSKPKLNTVVRVTGT